MFMDLTDTISFEIDDPKAKQAVNRDRIKVAMLPQSTSPYGSATEYFECSISGLLETNEYDIILAPEYDFVPRSGPLTKNEKDILVGRLLKCSSGKDSLLFPGTIAWKDENGVMKNMIPVIHDGKVLLEYTKMHDGGEDELAKRKSLAASYGDVAGTFRWKGYDFGLEICADHGRGALNSANEKVDFHVIVSCGMALCNDLVVSREDGYVMICDGCYNMAKIFRVGNGGMAQVTSSSPQAI